MIHDEIIDNLDYFYDHQLLYKDIVIYEIFQIIRMMKRF